MNTKKSGFIFMMVLSLCAGCGNAPSVEIVGSFFPAWMICLSAAVILTFAVRYLLLRYRLEPEIGPLALIYPCIAVFFAAMLWLILFW